MLAVFISNFHVKMERQMAKVTLIFEDEGPTEEGGWIRIEKFVIDPPFTDKHKTKNGMLDPNKISAAQHLGNAIGLMMQKSVTEKRTIQ